MSDMTKQEALDKIDELKKFVISDKPLVERVMYQTGKVSLRIAFDVDDTLLLPSVATGLPIDTPNHEVIAVYKWFQQQGHHMIVWSGSGIDWAQTWAEKLGLQPDEILVKEKREDVDLAFDDCDVNLAKVNIKVKRLNNSVSRKEWNENKR